MAYFANGSEGHILDAQCGECKLFDDPCPVALVQMEYNYDQVGNQMAREIINNLVDVKGICQLKPLIDKL